MESCRREKVLELCQKHLSSDIRTHDDIDILDISGYSNITYIVTHKENEKSKIIVRFFESKVSYDSERQIFGLMGEKRLGP